MKPCPAMKHLIEQLADKHGINLSQVGAQFHLKMEGLDSLVVENLGYGQLLVAHYFTYNGDLVPDPAIVFFISHANGWIPLQITMSLTGTQTYVLMSIDHLTVLVHHVATQEILAEFAEMWAQQIEAQGWLDSSLSEPNDETVIDRIPGCESTHPGPCYGELWQCANCGKTVCCAEGTDNHPELCDDCWCQRLTDEEEVDVPF